MSDALSDVANQAKQALNLTSDSINNIFGQANRAFVNLMIIAVGNLEKLSQQQDEDAWPQEIEALSDIKSGKTEMETKSADDFLEELKELQDEP